MRKHGEEWREVTAAQPAGRSRVASAQFRLALPRIPRAAARGASLLFYPPIIIKFFSSSFENMVFQNGIRELDLRTKALREGAGDYTYLCSM